MRVHNREMLPADILLVAAHEPDQSNPVGACHVETKSLDGETNLKGKSAPAGLAAELGPTVETQLHSWAALNGRRHALTRPRSRLPLAALPSTAPG